MRNVKKGDVGYYIDRNTNKKTLCVIADLPTNNVLLVKPFEYKYSLVKIKENRFVLIVKSKNNH